MARILFIQPPLLKSELFVRGAEKTASIIPPLGLAYIAAYLKQDDDAHEIEILDGIAEPCSLQEVAQKAHDFDFLGMTAISTYAVRVIELIHAIKKAGVKAPIIVGGPHVTADPESLMEEGADYAVIGEGELTFTELINHLDKNVGELSEVRGIMYDDNGTFTKTRPRMLFDSLDDVPLPARDLLPMHLYKSSVTRSTASPSHSIMTSRGCEGTCTFCNKRIFGRKVRYHSVNRIVDEFFLLRDKYGAQDVAVWDDNFTSSHEVVSQVCDELIRRKWDKSWSVESRVDTVSKESLKKLREAGCTYIAYGLESGSQRLLDYMKKGTTLEKIKETVRVTQEVGIKIRGYFMMGYPTETREEMLQTINWAIELDIELASFTMFIPLPGTVEYKKAKGAPGFDADYFRKLIVPEFNLPEIPIFIPESVTGEELLALHRSAYRRYYFRPKILGRKILECFRNPSEIYPSMLGGMTLIGDMLSAYKRTVNPVHISNESADFRKNRDQKINACESSGV